MNTKQNEDFNTALNIYINAYSHEDLINLLKNGSDVEKQVAALKLDKINSEFEAEILMGNLTGCDGKIREAVSFRLKEFVFENPKFYEKFSNIFLDAIIDINGNICRNTLSAIQNLKDYPEFHLNFCPKLINYTEKSIEKVNEFDIQSGKYKINKEIFKLYWYLETIFIFLDYIDKNSLSKIISQTKNINEYTIREKTAKILSKISSDSELLKIKEELKNDPNYYVRRF